MIIQMLADAKTQYNNVPDTALHLTAIPLRSIAAGATNMY